MQPEIEKYLIDMLTSATIIVEHTSSIKEFTQFQRLEILTKDGIQRRLAIIGEALYKADKLDKALNITGKRKIIGLRHIIVHDYDKVDEGILFSIIVKDLSPLIEEIKKLLE